MIPRILRLGGIAVVTAALAIAITGCGAGLNAQSNPPSSPVDGTTTKVESMTIANAFVLGPKSGDTLPAGSTAVLSMTLVNSSDANDQLINVTAGEVALRVTLVDGPIVVPARQLVRLGETTPRVILRGLVEPLREGEFVSLTLVFERAGTVTFQAPVLTAGAEPPHTLTATPTATAVGRH